MQTIKTFLTSSRMKSLYWRSAMMFLAGFSDILTQAIGGFNLTPEAKVFLGLILGEISKMLNNALR